MKDEPRFDAPAPMKRKIAAILAADVVGFSRLVAEDEEETLRRLGDYREVFDAFVLRYGGRIFNTAGDAVMCEFESAVEAVRCAIDIQEALRTRNLNHPPNRRLEFRIGMTIGDVVERGGDLLGDGVNIAARLEGLAEPGGICISRSVHEAVANKISVPFRDIGPRSVKNIPSPVHAFMVDWADNSQDAGDGEKSRGRSARSLILTLSLACLVVMAIAIAAILMREGQPQTAAPSTAGPAADFAELTQRGGLVDRPADVVAFYHNARIFEARGDNAAARRAYGELTGFQREVLDPHLRYAALLRAQDGRAAARETYGDLAERRPAKVVSLVHALQFEGAERRQRVEAFTQANPEVGPAFYLLSEEYSQDRLGTQTLSDKRREHAALETFLDAEADGSLSAFFLDQSVLSGWIDRARARKAALVSYFAGAQTRPTAQFSRSNTGWIMSLSLPEPATQITYRIGEAGEFRSTGTTGIADQRTGKPMPNPAVELPADQAAATIQIAYVDAAGREAGPFPVPFDPAQALISSQKNVLEQFPGSWLAFRQDMAELIYFTHLVSNRCAIEGAIIGYDDGPLEHSLTLPPCDPKNPYAIPANAPVYLRIPAGVRSISAQLSYADGTVSEVRTFRR